MWAVWELKSHTEVRDWVGAFEMFHPKIRGTFSCGNNVMQIQIFFGGEPEDSAKLSEIASQLLSIDFNNINFGKLLFLVPKRGRVQKSELTFKRRSKFAAIQEHSRINNDK